MRPRRPHLRPAACLLLTVVLAASFAGVTPALSSPDEPREVAVTFDDLPMSGTAVPLVRMQAMTARLTAAIAAHGLPVVGFVNESKLRVEGESQQRAALLEQWLDAGAELGNHTDSHPSLHTTPLEEYQRDVIRGETVTRGLLEARGGKLRWFRHPFLRTGPTRAVRDEFERFLAGRGYRVAPVTLDNSDWIFAAVYADAKGRDDRETMQRVARDYAPYMGAMLDYYENLAQRLLGRPIRHVLLLHANELNADHLEALVAMFRRRGYRFVTLEAALEDSAYRLPDDYAGPAGVSWLHRWAFTRGLGQTWREEPEPPAGVMELYRSLSR